MEHSMDVWFLIMEMVLLLGLAFVLGAVAQRFNQNAIIGYLLAGAILGPIMFNRQAVQDIAELGVALLLFSIGLEFSFSRLKRMGLRAFLIGLLQILITLGVFTLIFTTRGPFSQALAIGAIIALSSTAIILRVLSDRAEIDSIHGRNALAILLTQDAAVVPLVILVTLLGHGGKPLDVTLQMIKTLGAAGGLAAVFYLLFYILIPKVLTTSRLFANRDLVVLLAIFTAIGSAWAAHAIGLSPALGAFIAGMLLAESQFATQFRADVGTLRTLFVTLFFTSIGMLANPAWFLSNWYLALFWLAVVFVVKALIIFIICLVFRFDRLSSLATGITLAQIGEFSFVLAAEVNQSGVLSKDLFDLIVTVTILSMFLAPYMATYAAVLSNRFFKRIKLVPGRENQEEENDLIHEAKPFFIIGFGPAGQRVADVLLAKGHYPAVIELSPRTAELARNKGLDVFMVDATLNENIDHIGIKGACLVIVTVPDPRAAKNIIGNVRLYAPKAMIIARSRYHIATDSLKEAGADAVIDEENSIGDELARAVTEVSLFGDQIAIDTKA